ncbi:hypothetical protein IVB18_47285 [Bradyrhizobium sp. 186]|uniref:hypothetical protein n=1 Tax=Bradyrhizobium sp. 186 TaxID=2782654 RepID=UPI0020018718|nr:hypothetical protein [Bradyrhizobium sp. 186]UPK35470.1 hypothetical protein IVB18_47285 [Bradyrhizobium sp. 186]
MPKGAKLPDPLVDEHVEAINACWLKHGDVDNEVANACHRANIALDAPAKKLLMKRLLFSAPKFSKYASIGGDARLLDPKRAHKIPQSPSIKYELSQLEDDEFDEFEAEGRLEPTAKRKEIIDWRRKKRGEPPPSATPVALPGRFYAALKPKRQLAASEEDKIQSVLMELAKSHEIEVVYPEMKLRTGAYGKALAHMRREARKRVAAVIKRKKKTQGPHAFAREPALRRYAGFYADELAIYSDADEDRLLEVLSALGIEDEFPGIREEAYDKYRADEPYEMPDWVKAVENRPPSAEGLAADAEQVREALHRMASRRPTWGDLKDRLADVK